MPVAYEVFLSFRGPDTHNNFTSHLYKASNDEKICVFMDSKSLHYGKSIGGELLEAIEQSKILIPIFSKNYVSSSWCLRELAHMVECAKKSNGNKEILPIFLDVNPADVKLKTNLYRKALSKHYKEFPAEVESWRKALIEMGRTNGWNWKKYRSQADLIKSLRKTVLTMLNRASKKDVPEYLVGVDPQAEAIIKENLSRESNSARFLGLKGMGGIGKISTDKGISN